ncbi:MAG TPA: hypothetical protein VEW74_05365 [Candidatus Nitrosotalea sp.]|nr:hypothetical protein [Candidatus Nitrosotalea sp.]
MADFNLRHARGPFWLELIVAASAILISVASLWVAVRAGQTQERLLAANVWPYLQFQTSDFPTPVSEIAFWLQNAGVGPARLRWATLYYKDRPYASAQAAFLACCAAKLTKRNGITQYLQSRVMTPSQMVKFISVTKAGTDPAAWNRLDVERLNFHLRACYCSVLDDCWIFDDRRSQPQPVNDCPPAVQPAFNG